MQWQKIWSSKSSQQINLQYLLYQHTWNITWLSLLSPLYRSPPKLDTSPVAKRSLALRGRWMKSSARCAGKTFNSLAPGRSECNSKNVIFNLVLLIGIFRSSHDNALRWMPQDLTDDNSTLVQVMAWCRQATSHYLSQCWLSSLSPMASPQWVSISFSLQSLQEVQLEYHGLVSMKFITAAFISLRKNLRFTLSRRLFSSEATALVIQDK